MSGDLEDPSKSIPKGTLWAVGSTFCVYTCIIILMGGSISRSTMYTDLSVLQDVCSCGLRQPSLIFVPEGSNSHAFHADVYYFLRLKYHLRSPSPHCSLPQEHSQRLFLRH